MTRASMSWTTSWTTHMHSRIDLDGRVLHYGQPAFDGQCEYEGCKNYAHTGRHCWAHTRRY